jgi:hypothetical protein
VSARILLLLPAVATVLAYAPVTTFEGIPLRRNDAGAIRFFVNREGAPEGAVLPALQAAADSWGGVPSSAVRFEPIESDSAVADPFDGRNMIVFADTPENRSIAGSAIAVTVAVYFETGEIYESDIVFNPAYRFSTGQAEDTFDVQTVAAHEMGHALGANHSGLLSSTMYHATSRRGAKPTVGHDDEAFLTHFYGQGGDADWRSSACGAGGRIRSQHGRNGRGLGKLHRRQLLHHGAARRLLSLCRAARRPGTRA